jgi:hypothetical protein
VSLSPSGADMWPWWPGIGRRGCLRADPMSLLWRGNVGCVTTPSWRCAALVVPPSVGRMPSSLCGGHHCRGNGVLRADRVTHPWGALGVAGVAVRSPQRQGAPSLAPPSAVDWCLLQSVLGHRWHWWCGRCCREAGVAVDIGAARANFLSLRLFLG